MMGVHMKQPVMHFETLYEEAQACLQLGSNAMSLLEVPKILEVLRIAIVMGWRRCCVASTTDVTVILQRNMS